MADFEIHITDFKVIETLGYVSFWCRNNSSVTIPSYAAKYDWWL